MYNRYIQPCSKNNQDQERKMYYETEELSEDIGSLNPILYHNFPKENKKLEIYDALNDWRCSASQFSLHPSHSSQISSSSNELNVQKEYKKACLINCTMCSERKRRLVNDTNIKTIQWGQYIEKLEDIKCSNILRQSSVQGEDNSFQTKSNSQDAEFLTQTCKQQFHNQDCKSQQELKKISITYNDFMSEMVKSIEKNMEYVLSMITYDMLLSKCIIKNVMVSLQRNTATKIKSFKRNFKPVNQCKSKIENYFFNYKATVQNKKTEIYETAKNFLHVMKGSPRQSLKFHNENVNEKQEQNTDKRCMDSIKNELREIKEILLFYKDKTGTNLGGKLLGNIEVNSEILKSMSESSVPTPPPPPPMSSLRPSSTLHLKVEKICKHKDSSSDSSHVRPTITVEALKSVKLKKTPRELKMNENQENKTTNAKNKELRANNNMQLIALKTVKLKSTDTNKAKTLRY